VTAWWEGRLVGLDVESTGVDIETDRIVTAAVVACGGGVATESLTLLADPGVDIPEAATAVHGITTERARSEGQPAGQVVAAVLVALEAHLHHGRPLVVMNARFDLTLLDREARRYGLVPLQDRVDLLVVDPSVCDKHLDRYRRGSRKLDAICEHYGAGLDEAHDAGADALAACRLAWCIGKRGQVVRRVRNGVDAREKGALVREWEAVRHDLPRLHAAQQRWAHEQAVGLAAHFRSQGAAAKGDPDGVRAEWPIVPAAARAAA
jgi:DNA polymerase III epsilon subunit-like protein